MKKPHVASFLISLLIVFFQPVVAQPASSYPESKLTRQEVESHLRFLASDELQGRKTGEPGNRIAARYIAEQFRMLGLKPAEVAEDVEGQEGAWLRKAKP